MVANQISGPNLVGDHQTNKHDRYQTRRDSKESHTPCQDAFEAVTEVIKVDDEAAGTGISNKMEDAGKTNYRSDSQGLSNEKEETSKAYDDEATGQRIGKEKELASNVVDLDETDVDDANIQQRDPEVDETNSDNDLTDDAKTDEKNVAPPSENHKLFTGERLGDFSFTENIDWLLTMGNGGKIPTPSKKTRRGSPPRSPSFPADAAVQTEVGRIINEIRFYKDWHGHPGGSTKLLFYASAEGQRLAAELKRLMAIATPVVNAIMPLAESQARLRFYQQLESRAIKEKRDREFQQGMHRYYGAPVPMQQWIPPVAFPVPPPLPSNGPMQVPFVRRGNVIAAPPGGRNVEEEKRAETYGYPPKPGSRPGASQQGQKRKRAARH